MIEATRDGGKSKIRCRNASQPHERHGRKVRSCPRQNGFDPVRVLVGCFGSWRNRLGRNVDEHVRSQVQRLDGDLRDELVHALRKGLAGALVKNGWRKIAARRSHTKRPASSCSFCGGQEGSRK